MWTVYILISEKDGKNYIGSTNDLDRRLGEHNTGKVISTKNRRPFRVLYTQTFLTEQEARLKEKYFKTHKGYNELKRILDRLGPAPTGP